MPNSDLDAVALVAKETTTGQASAEALAEATDAVKVLNFRRSVRGNPVVESNDTHQAYPGGDDPQVGHIGYRFEFDTYLYHPTTAGDITTSPLGNLLRSSPTALTVSAGVSVTLTPAQTFVLGTGTSSGQVETVTVGYADMDGAAGTPSNSNLYKLHNGVSAWKIGAQVGQQARVAWTTDGKWNAVGTSGIDYTAVDYTAISHAKRAPNFMGATLTFSTSAGAMSAAVRAFEFDPGYQLIDNEDATQTNGFGISSCYRRAYSTLMLEVEARNEQLDSVYADARAGTEFSGVVLKWGSAAGNTQCTITLPLAKLKWPEHNAYNSTRAYNLTLMSYYAADGSSQPWSILLD